MKKPTREELQKAEEFLLKHPELMVWIGLLAIAFMTQKEGKRPRHLSDMPPIHPRTAGPWRGKGSFGHGFGPNKVSHK